MISNIRIKLSDLIFSFSRALDFVNSRVANHHLRVGIIASEIARSFGMSREEINNIFLASAIHDIGFFLQKKSLTPLNLKLQTHICTLKRDI